MLTFGMRQNLIMATGESLSIVREMALVDSENLVAATERLRSDLAHHSTLTQEIAQTVATGAPIVDALLAGQSSSWRPALSDSIRNFEKIRHRTRLRLIAVALEDGMTLLDVAREWGITRQLATRYAREIEDLEAASAQSEPT